MVLYMDCQSSSVYVGWKRSEMKMDREDIYEMMIWEMRETAVRERNEHSPEYQELQDKVARLNKELQER